MLKNKNGANPFSVIEMLPEHQLPSKEVLDFAKEWYPKVTMPDTVRAWNKEVIFGYYECKNNVTHLNELIFSDNKNIRWECE